MARMTIVVVDEADDLLAGLDEDNSFDRRGQQGIHEPARRESRRPYDLDTPAEKLEDRRKDYNEVRPHRAIGNKPPVCLSSTSAGASSPPA